eukprot:gnl/Chilomastix_caulleri/580.p1 GENE.gnl/Chilomastix_caulleri/580~~gnl/Chilomastix_caulleri/580.p1  ORF type:complete len:154 (+),score=42.11 gnl/Chilomastix_caulleri/580:221-682(+)
MEHDAAMLELGKITSLCDTAGVSWIYWQYKPYHDITTQCEDSEGVFNPDGTEQEKKLAQLSYPYPQKVAGDITGWTYDKDTKKFNMVYRTPSDNSKFLDKRTVIFIGAKHQATYGYDLNITPRSAVEYTNDGIYLTITPLVANVDVTVEIEFY